MTTCPACQRTLPGRVEECPACGLILAKWKGGISRSANRGDTSKSLQSETPSDPETGSSAERAEPIGLGLGFLGTIDSVLWGTRSILIGLGVLGYLVKTLGFYGLLVWLALIPVIMWITLAVMSQNNRASGATRQTPEKDLVAHRRTSMGSLSPGGRGSERRSPSKIPTRQVERITLHKHWLLVSNFFVLIVVVFIGFVFVLGISGFGVSQQDVIVRVAPVTEALEGYHRQVGTYPKTLDALCPGYLAELPRCPVGRLHYFRNDDAAGYMMMCITQTLFFFPVAELRYDSATKTWLSRSHDDPW